MSVTGIAARRTCTILVIMWAVGCGDPPASEPVEEPTPMPGASPFAYPVELWDLGIEGEATLMVHVTERGAVDSAYVLTSSGFAEFDLAAVQGAHALQFSPAQRGDERIAMWTRLPVRFSMDSLAAPPSGGAAAGAVPASLREPGDSTPSPDE